MWYAARDVAFENPVTEDQRALMLERHGNRAAGQRRQDRRRRPAGRRRWPTATWPDDVDFDLESLIARMVRLLLIEISAFHTFAWAEELLADPDLVAGDGEGARLVSYIRADETPHVDYLRTALSELHDRTIAGEGGRKHAGADLVGATWDRALALSIGPTDRRPSRPRGARCGTPSATVPGAADLLGPVRRAGLGPSSGRRLLGRGDRDGLIRPLGPVWRVPHGTARSHNLRPVQRPPAVSR